MNKVNLIGRLTKDPVVNTTSTNNTSVCNITIAVDKYNSKTGQREADFIPVIVWGKNAENLAKYMSKGGLISVSGRIQTRSYEKDGTKRYVMEVVADTFGGIEFLSGRKQIENDNSNQKDEDITPVDDGDMLF